MSDETTTTLAEEFDPEVHATETDGRPKVTRDGRLAKKRGPKSTGAAPRAASPRRPSSSRTRSTSSRPKAPDFRPGINGMFQLLAAPLAFVQPLDAYAVATHGPNIAEALNDLAQERPEIAVVLQRILAVGPYGALLAATVPLVVQLLHNHDVIPEQAATGIPGVAPKSELLNVLGMVPKEAPEEEKQSVYGYSHGERTAGPGFDNDVDNVVGLGQVV